MQSESELVRNAKRAVAQHPEAIQALLEFERTHRLRKTVYRRRIDATIDEDVLRRFRTLCEKNGVPLSRAIERLMLGALRTASRDERQSRNQP